MVACRVRGFFAFVLVCMLASAYVPDAAGQDASAPTADAPGALVGVVVDAQRGEPLPGANVSIAGTTTGTSTDLNGRYRLGGLEPGTYDVLYSFVGFQEKTVTGVEVTAGETTRIEVTLAERTAEMDEVVIEAAAARDTEAGLLRQRAEAAAVSDAISSEAMSNIGAGTAAAAMKKVTGASVVDGKYVYVRGLGGRYSNTQLNGVQIPSSDPDRNAVQLDLFPASALQNIVTQKTFTPDQPGNFAGGLVNINTETFPEEFSFKLSTSASVNTETHFTDQFLTQNGGSLDFLGIDDGTRAVPTPVEGASIPSITQARRNAQLQDQLDALSKSFNPHMAPVEGRSPINQGYSLSLGNQSRAFGGPLGYVFSLTYDRSASFYNDGFTGRYDPPAELGGQPAPTILLNDSKGTDEVSWGSTANINYQITPSQEVGLDVLYTRTGTQESRFQIGGWPDENGPGDPSRLINRTLSFTERRLGSAQLRGEHYFEGLSGLTLEWTAAYSDTQQDQPDKRFFPSQTKIGAQGDSTFIAQASGFPDPSRVYRSLTETSANGRLDITLPFRQWAGDKARLKVGAAYKQDERNFREQFFSFSPNAITFNDLRGDPETFFSDENMGLIDPGRISGPINPPVFGNVVQQNIEDQNNYTGDREVAAGYAMIELPLVERLRATLGARWETTVQTVRLTGNGSSADDGDADTTPGGRIDEGDLLPALNLRYELRDNMNLRAAVSRTLARPTFREFGPFSLFDTGVFDFVIGNPELDRTLITNVDLRWEWFRRAGEIFAASVFYKDMENPIERALLGTTNGQQTWSNVPDGDVYGLELEVRSRLDFVHPSLEYLTLGANGSLIESEVSVPDTELPPDEKGRGATRQLQGQSPYTVNVDLTYENPEVGTTTGLYFNIYGERLSSVGLFAAPNAFEQPFAQLDFNVSQRLLDHWTVEASVGNLLGDEFEETVENASGSFTYQRYERGRTFSVGLSYEL
jgi:TonB-dependent receptor